MNELATPAFISAIAALAGVLVNLYIGLRSHRTIHKIDRQTNGVLESYVHEVRLLRRQLDDARRRFPVGEPDDRRHEEGPAGS